MLDLTKEEDINPSGFDITATARPLVLPITEDKLEERAVKYDMALAEASPGLGKVKELLTSPGGEDVIRDTAKNKEEADRREAGNKVFSEETTMDGETLRSVAEASRRPVDRQIALEKRYAERVFATSLALTKNPEEVNEEAPKEVSQEMYDFLVDTLGRREIYTKVYEDVQARNKAAGWGSFAWNLGETMIPLYSGETQKNDALGEKLSSILPGNNKTEQYAYLQSLSTEEAAALVKTISEEMYAANPLEAEDWLRGLVEGYDAGSEVLDNTLYALDVAGVVGAVTKKVGSKIVKGVVDSAGAAKRVKEAQKLTKSYVARKEAANNVVATPAEAAGPLTQKELAKRAIERNAVKERLLRTTQAILQPGAKVDEILAASGHLEEAADIKALAFARELAVKDSYSAKEGIAALSKQTPMLFDPVHRFIDMSKGHLTRAVGLKDTLVRNRDLFISAVQDVMKVQRLPFDVEVAALNLATKAFKDEMAQGGLDKAIIGAIEKYHSQDTASGLSYIEAKLGQKDGTLFKSAKIAENVAKNRYMFPEKTFSVVQEGDGYAISFRRDIDEIEAIRTAPIPTSNISRNKLLGIVPIPKSISGAKETFNAHQVAERATLTHAQTALNRLFNEMSKPVAALGKEERRALTKIMEANRDEYRIPGEPDTRGKFYNNLNELEEAYLDKIGRLPTDKEVEAYATFVQQSDMDYIFRSWSEIKQKSRMGISKLEAQVGSTTLKFEGLVVDKIPFNQGHNGGIFVVIGGNGHFRRLNDAGVAENLPKYIEENDMKILQVYDPEDGYMQAMLKTDETVNFVVVPSYRKGALRFDEQLPYRPGFHVKYKDDFFIKQGTFAKDLDGKLVHKGDTAILGVSNEVKAMQELKLLERARIAIRDGNIAELDNIIRDGMPYTKKELQTLFSTRLSPEIPIVITRSGQSASDPAVRTLGGKALTAEIGEFSSNVNNPLNLARRVRNEFVGHKDGPLFSVKNSGTEDKPLWSMEYARMVDPIQTQTAAFNRLIRDRHFQDYQISSAETFVREFNDLLSKDGVETVSEMEMLRNPVWWAMNGVIRGSGVEARVAAAKQSQLAIKNILRHSSVMNKAMTVFRGKMMNTMQSWKGEKLAIAIDDKLATISPDIPTAMRAIAFHTKLGLFNPVQIALQGQTLFAISAIAPRHGAGAVYASSIMKFMNFQPGNKALGDALFKRAAKLTPGWTEENFRESWRLLNKTGFDIVGREASVRNNVEDVKIFKGATSNILDAGAIFFNSTEGFVRMSAWNTAYKEYVEKFPKLVGKLTDQDAKTILVRAQDLSINMQRDAHAVWQEGSMSMITQFWGYSMRMFDLLTGKRLTGAEKARLVAINSALYGIPIGVTPMLPIYPWEDTLRQSLMEAGVNTNEGAVGVAMNGILASVIAGVTEANGERIQLDIGGRWGPNALQTIWNLQNLAYGEDGLDAFFEVFGGASGTILGQMVFNDAIPVIKDFAYIARTGGAEGDNVLLADMNTFAKNFSTYNVAERAYIAFNLGVWKAKDGRVIDDDYGVMEGAFHAMTGIESQEVSDTFLMFKSNREMDEFNYKIGKDGKKFIRLMLEARSRGDMDAVEEYRNRARTIFDGANWTLKQRQNAFKSVLKEKAMKGTAEDSFIKKPNSPDEEKARKEMLRGN